MQSLTKQAILSLLRRCHRSVQRIPDPGQRASYLLVVRDGFHRRMQLPPNSREAILAYRDGLEQVEQMEYYHSLREQKQKQKQNGKMSAVSSNNAAQNDKMIHVRADAQTKEGDCNPNEEISQWLLHHLPYLQQEDVSKYTQQLVEDGFDSVAFIEKELIAEDLSFMKRAHRRLVERELKLRSKDDAAGNK